MKNVKEVRKHGGQNKEIKCLYIGVTKIKNGGEEIFKQQSLSIFWNRRKDK